jgi:DnaK suppressor protein
MEKTRYTDQELLEFESLIEKKLVEAYKLYDFYKGQLQDKSLSGEAKLRGYDHSAETFETENINMLAARQSKYIKHLENAKLRISNKVYGICRETGKLISKERLMAVPHATLSIEAKKSN